MSIKNIGTAFQSSQSEFFAILLEETHKVMSNKENILALLARVVLSDWIHILTDKVYSAVKKLI